MGLGRVLLFLGRVLLFLASIFSFTRPGAAAELHSLRYNVTVLSRDGSVQSEFLAEGHLDGQLFVRYDRETRRARPQGQWAEAVLGDQETEDLTENAQDLRRTLTHIEGQKGGLHSLQEIKVCEIHEDNSTGGLRHFYYDGELFLSLNLETQKWTVAQSSRAQTLAMNFWKEDTMKTKTHYRTVQADCLKKLQRYLESGVAVRRTVPPMVNVTHGEASEGNITVTCRASGFYPGNITLTWRQDGVSLSHDAQQWGDVLPDWNGTYQTWVATKIRQGEEQKFACYMEHSGNHSTHPVPSGKPPVLQSERLNLLYVLVAVAVAITAFIIICVHCCKKKKTSAAEGP
ncbi:hypothetical protein EGM_19426, partial [Macaca fascicularis]